MLTIRDELRIRNIAHAIMQDTQRPFGSRFLDCSVFLDKMVRDGECTFQEARIFLRDAELMAREEVGEPENEDYIILMHRAAENGAGEYVVRFYHSFTESKYDWDSIGELSEGWTACWEVYDDLQWRTIERID